MAITAIVASTVVGAGVSIVQGNKQRKQQERQLDMQRKANEDAKTRAKEAADRQDVETNRANRKRADVSAIQSKEEQASLSGPAGTMLTGVEGVKTEDLTLGGNTLLGS